MPTATRLRPKVLEVRQQLAEERQRLRGQHDRGLEGARAKQLCKALNAAIVPLIFVFVASVALKVLEVLS